VKIAILGTRGIPNSYGGFERFAEVLSQILVARGHLVYVLSPTFNGKGRSVTRLSSMLFLVNVGVGKHLPHNFQTLHYDLKSLCWANTEEIDVILECGHSFAPWLPLFKKTFRQKIVVNLDGLEHKRSKWSKPAKLFLRFSEYMAVHFVARLVCDNQALVSYYAASYGVKPKVIPYGAFPLGEIPPRDVLAMYGIFEPYYLMVSRLTPENNIEMIARSFVALGENLIIIGRYDTRFGESLYRKFEHFKNIRFLGPNFNQDDLNALRYHSLAYIHGHTVGGTNPSLLEAMACKCFVIAHDNPFNREVLGDEGWYFDRTTELKDRSREFGRVPGMCVLKAKQSNYTRIKNLYSWEAVADSYEELFSSINSQQDQG